MTEMQTLKVDFSDIPDAPPVQRKKLFVDFPDIPDAVAQAQYEQMPQLRANPLSGEKVLKVDFSDIPDSLPIQRKALRVDFSDIPDAEPSAVTPSDQREKKPEDSWFWKTLETNDTLKPYAKGLRQYVESPTDTKGVWEWLTSTIPKSAAQLGVGLAKMPFDIAQTFSGESQAAIEKFVHEHPEYEQVVREDPSGESLQALAGIGMGAGILEAADATAKGAAAFIGKPLGIDTEKQTWTWENFKDAWVNHPVESFAAVYPFGASFLKRQGITPSETQVKELVDAAVKDEKTPLAQGLKKEMEQGPPPEVPVGQNKGAEPGAAELPAETSEGVKEAGGQEMKNVAEASPGTDRVGEEFQEPQQPQKGEKRSEGLSTSEQREFQEAEEAAISESTPRLYKSLVKNLEAQGIPRPPGHVAHHLVAVLDRRAEPARTILREFDIPFDSTDNGLWLPGIKGAREGAFHPALNTNNYHFEINRRLGEAATSRETIQAALHDIKQELSENKFPY